MITAPTGILLSTIEPGSPEWMTRMSASKVAAVLGLSPYESRFSLWHRMAGLIDRVPESTEMRRGHYLEPACAQWFADQHPDWQVTPTGTWVHGTDNRWAATPDRLVTCADGEVRLLECKTEGSDEKWGEKLSDDIPVHHRAQAQWQMFVTGARVTHFAMLSSFLEFREYIVQYDEADVARLVPAAEEFMDSLPDGPNPQRPSLDDHTATYQAVRELHPQISGTEFDVPLDLAREFCGATLARKAADKAETKARSRLADAMGDAKKAMWLDTCIATRQVRGNGVPFLKASTTLPAFDKEEATAA